VQKPKRIEIPLHYLTTLLLYYRAGRDREVVGDLGDRTYDQTLTDIEKQSQILLTYEQLDSLLYHFKQCVVNRVSPGKEKQVTNYNFFMEELARVAPNMFKRDASSGEVKLIEFYPDGF
jgi:hypothetical protein